MFWSSDKIVEKHNLETLIDPFEPSGINQASYELTLGPQSAVSCDGHNEPTNLKPRETLTIPGGQFALLLTEEVVSIPSDAVAFISLKTKVKSLGLVNVSGFHVDPGFRGRLKFWVYNAGNHDIQILRGDRTFLIWFSDLDRPTRDPYEKNGSDRNEITADDLRRLQGRLASPAALSKRISELDHKVEVVQWIGKTFLGVVLAILMILVSKSLGFWWDSSGKKISDQEKLESQSEVLQNSVDQKVEAVQN